MLGKKILVFLVQMLLYHGVSFFLARSKANKTPVPAFKIQQKGKKISRKVTKCFASEVTKGQHSYTCFPSKDVGVKAQVVFADVETAMNQDVLLESTRVF